MLNTINSLLNFHNITAPVTVTEWSEKPDLTNKKARGVYIIFKDDVIYYVGKGFIRDRQTTHRQKFLGEFKNARDTRGFKKLREEHGIVDVDNLSFCYIVLTQESAIGCIETGLIHMLQPLANDETNKG